MRNASRVVLEAVASPPNPFRYGSPVTGANFTGRTVEHQALVSRMADGLNVSLVSPRRYGKTSLLLRAEGTITRAGASVVHVNVLRCPDLGHFAAALATGLAQTHGRRLRRGVAAASDFRRRFRVTPAVELGDDGKARFSFVPSLAAKDATSVLEDVYRLLAEGDRSGVLVLDEFDAIVDLNPTLPNAFKGLADSYPQVSLVVAGSRRHMMERLVHVHGAPLYGMTQPISLGPIDPDAMARYLVRRSAAGDKKMPPAIAGTIIGRIGPVPNDIQHLAYETFAVASGPIITDADVDTGLAQAISLAEATYSVTWHERPVVQRRVLSALAAQPTGEPFGGAFARRTGLATSSVQRAIEALVNDEWVADDGGLWHLTDPFLARWVQAEDPR